MTGESASRRTSKEDSVEGGTKGDDGPAQVAPAKKFPAKLMQSKSDENEIQVLERLDHGGNEGVQENKQAASAVGWVCCAPCIWLRTSTTVHKIALTAATLLVTSLLVVSPILFLISTAPSQAPRDCLTHKLEDCFATQQPPPECTTEDCRVAAMTIYARMNAKLDPCRDFKSYSCSPIINNSMSVVKSSQEGVDLQMQGLLESNTSSGVFHKLGRLYESCLRQSLNATSIRLLLEGLGGYLPSGSLGPSSIGPLISKIAALGPTPLIGIYFDLSYGRKPQIMLIIDGPTTSAPVLENTIRWMGPKAPPYKIRNDVPELLDDLMNVFLPSSLSKEQRQSEKDLIRNFVSELNRLRQHHLDRDFSNSYVVYNVTTLSATYSYLKWNDVIPQNWSGPIVVRSLAYFNRLHTLLSPLKHQTRVIHNALLLLFALGALPPTHPSPVACTKATMWALPQASSALYMAHHSIETVRKSINRVEILFETLKAHLKRAPSLRGAALVKLSSLKIQANPWPLWYNQTKIGEMLDMVDITSDNWFENILKLYKLQQQQFPNDNMTMDSHVAWAYPILAQSFYDTLSHSIVVPLSVVLVPYFKPKLPPYMHYSSVGVQIAKEILRSITRAFEDKALKCVPGSVNVFSNSSRMDILIHSGGMQIAYHSLLSLTGPIKGMERLGGLNLTPTQIFYLVSAQELCADSLYAGIDTDSDDFTDILGWLIAQGGSANDVFHCPHGSVINTKKTCNIL
ncbi:endothelin-converting enzyme 2 isoform X2 [Lutzomyia longipalpis]|uniref:endothelin-converting enzyme 2 isoform X2 n=1 Tax=Lutzomyia longipalpis TaxID=7200 RepID=UPI00248378E8|nr:endothelin-converting enzyme 2 isoform X2 [Lutzomyia longipalpis]